MKRWRKRIAWMCLALVAIALLAYAFIPKPVDVDLADVDRGPMQVTVNQEGKTRVRDRYTVSAPLAGELQRIDFKAGDVVEAGKTVLAVIVPTPPSLLDVRAREEAEARVGAADAALKRTQANIARIDAELAQARIDLNRAEVLRSSDSVPQQRLDDTRLAVQVKEADQRFARSAQEVARFELDQAKAALRMASAMATATAATTSPTTREAALPVSFEIRSPIDGRILRVIQESAVPVTPGAQLLEIGNVTQLEAVIDVLSRDAVNIRPGAKVYLDRWGGEQPLTGRVRRVEPSGFTKISALGVEEQRVNAIVDFSVPDGESPPGDYFRVDARIVTWERPDVLRVPSGALFRHGEPWAVYVVQNERAGLREVKIGRMNGAWGEVLEGLKPNEKVILHPSDKVSPGRSVRPRQ